MKSANETRYRLSLIKETGISKGYSKIDKMIKEAEELAKVIASIVLKMSV